MEEPSFISFEIDQMPVPRQILIQNRPNILRQPMRQDDLAKNLHPIIAIVREPGSHCIELTWSHDSSLVIRPSIPLKAHCFSRQWRLHSNPFLMLLMSPKFC
jgi:hypothetical protein